MGATSIDNDLNLLTREQAADKSNYTETCRTAFIHGWDAAMREVAVLVQTRGGDGCYCAHHPDDPAHGRDCYDLFKALTGK
jgi:hypothetical protein